METKNFYRSEEDEKQGKAMKKLLQMLKIDEITPEQYQKGLESINKGENPVVFHQIKNKFGDEIRGAIEL